ncbi:MAG: phosphate acyltransferase [bacterium]|nr:phosphate acyltransferase [bacterium]
MRIAVDAAGGVFAPAAPVQGALAALSARGAPEHILLVGNRELIQREIGKRSDARVSIVEADEAISDHEAPLKGLHRLPRTTIVVAHELVKEGRADAVVSAGSTGAQLAASVLKWGKLRWVLKPAFGAVIPKPAGSGFILDVGANPTVAAVHLVQFAAMGAVFAEQLLNMKNPRVALLSNGEEANKGNDAVRGAHQILTRSNVLRFVGNIEGNEIFSDKADVIVTDGFTGNIFLKFAESLPALFGNEGSSRLAAFDPKRYGGVPILGVKGISVVCHGNSNADAITAAIIEANRMVKVQLTEKMEKLAAKLRWQRFLFKPRRGNGAAGEPV